MSNTIAWQAGTTRWLKLKPDSYEVIGQAKPCGTPGCRLPDWHNGPHTLEKVTCRSDAKRSTIRRRSPRFINVQFPWHALDLDLQAMVLLQLSGDVYELITYLYRLARVIRPLRAAILRAIQLNDDVNNLLSSSFIGSDCKLGAESSACKGSFWGVHDTGEPSSQVEEHMRVELRLLRPRTTPRSWKWMLLFHMSSSTADGCNMLRLLSIQVFYNPSERIGQLRRGRVRGHASCEQRGHVFAERKEMIESYGLRTRDVVVHFYPKLTTISENTIRLSSCNKPLFTWTLPCEAACVLKLVSAFV